jgi:hypothetical protein
VVGGSGVIATAVLIFWVTSVSGGLGGASGALYRLWLQTVRRSDFSRRELPWYMVRPMAGIAVGAAFFLVAAAALVLLDADLKSVSGDAQAQLALYLGAALASFAQPMVSAWFSRPRRRASELDR